MTKPGMVDFPAGYAAREIEFLKRFGFDPTDDWDGIHERYRTLSDSQREAIKAAWSDLMSESARAESNDPPRFE